MNRTQLPSVSLSLACALTAGWLACAKPPPAAESVSFAGVYETNWGEATLTQSGDEVSATYPRGTLKCRAAGDRLTCDWREGTMAGRAELTRRSDGKLRGSWGQGTSTSNGGEWVFSPKRSG